MLVLLLHAAVAALLTDPSTCIKNTGYKYCLKQDDSAGYCCASADTQAECLSTTLCSELIPATVNAQFYAKYSLFTPGLSTNRNSLCGSDLQVFA